jgi:hypothetical protein
MGKRRNRPSRPRRTSSADIGFGFLLLVLAAVLVVLATVMVEQVREANWTGAAISLGVALVLLAVGAYSVFQKKQR